MSKSILKKMIIIFFIFVEMRMKNKNLVNIYHSIFKLMMKWILMMKMLSFENIQILDF